MDSKHTSVLNIAKGYIGSNDYSWYKQNGNFAISQPKCNLFVGECLLKAGVNVQLIQILQTKRHFLFHSQWFKTWKNEQKLPGPPTASMWSDPQYDSKRFKVVGMGLLGLQKCWPGDIISDGNHCGIISGVRKVISASGKIGDFYKVVENDWGWRKGECQKAVVRRYRP